MVGNGVTDPFADSPLVALIPFLYGHGVFSTKIMNQINQYCNNSNDPNCQNAVNTVYNLMDDIDVSLCWQKIQKKYFLCYLSYYDWYKYFITWINSNFFAIDLRHLFRVLPPTPQR